MVCCQYFLVGAWNPPRGWCMVPGIGKIQIIKTARNGKLNEERRQRETNKKGKQYISTAAAGQVHRSDVFGVAVTKIFTITISGDGYLKLWKNRIGDTDEPKNNVTAVFVDKLGLHHVTVFEDVVSSVKVALVAVTTFAGKVLFYRIHDDGKLEKLLLQLDDKVAYWAIEFLYDSLKQEHKFVATTATGNTEIHDFSFTVENDKPKYEVKLFGVVQPRSPLFAMSLAVSSKAYLCATGYANGDIIVTEVEKARQVFNFNKPSISSESSGSTISSSIRSLRFSPSGDILAASYDSGNFGNISLYDTRFGELVGNLTTPSHSSSAKASINAHEGWIFAIDFNETGQLLVSGGFDGKLRVWDTETRERESTIYLSPDDFPDEETANLGGDLSGILDVKFIKKGIRGATGSDTNDGIVCVGMDRGVRWFREAGGI